MKNGVRGVADHETAPLEECIPFAFDCSRVRLYGSRCSGVPGLVRLVVLVASRGRAIALGNRVFIPDPHEGNLAVLAHELTHCGQYQAWGPVRYFARGALASSCAICSTESWARLQPLPLPGRAGQAVHIVRHGTAGADGGRQVPVTAGGSCRAVGLIHWLLMRMHMLLLVRRLVFP